MQAILIQGRTEYYKELSDCFFGWPNTVWSTRPDEPKENLDYIKSKGIDVIFHQMPIFPGDQNINYQTLSTFAGLNHLHAKGVKEVLKVRSDHTINDIRGLLEICYGRKLAFQALANVENRRDLVYQIGDYTSFGHDYPSDGIIYGEINGLMKMFNFETKDIYNAPPEALLVYNYMINNGLKFDLSYDYLIRNGISFFEGDCLAKGIKIQWLKRNQEMVKWFEDKFYYKW